LLAVAALANLMADEREIVENIQAFVNAAGGANVIVFIGNGDDDGVIALATRMVTTGIAESTRS
jgi:hypothetical protein